MLKNYYGFGVACLLLLMANSCGSEGVLPPNNTKSGTLSALPEVALNADFVVDNTFDIDPLNEDWDGDNLRATVGIRRDNGKKKWIAEFRTKHGDTTIPVVVQLRRNNKWNTTKTAIQTTQSTARITGQKTFELRVPKLLGLPLSWGDYPLTGGTGYNPHNDTNPGYQMRVIIGGGSPTDHLDRKVIPFDQGPVVIPQYVNSLPDMRGYEGKIPFISSWIDLTAKWNDAAQRLELKGPHTRTGDTDTYTPVTLMPYGNVIRGAVVNNFRTVNVLWLKFQSSDFISRGLLDITEEHVKWLKKTNDFIEQRLVELNGFGFNKKDVLDFYLWGANVDPDLHAYYHPETRVFLGVMPLNGGYGASEAPVYVKSSSGTAPNGKSNKLTAKDMHPHWIQD